jgi:hypothetical protein
MTFKFFRHHVDTFGRERATEWIPPNTGAPAGDPRADGISTNDYTATLPVRRQSIHARGRLLFLPSAGLTVVPYGDDFGLEHRRPITGWGCVVIEGTKTYSPDGHNIWVGGGEIETARERPLQPAPAYVWDPSPVQLVHGPQPGPTQQPEDLMLGHLQQQPEDPACGDPAPPRVSPIDVDPAAAGMSAWEYCSHLPLQNHAGMVKGRLLYLPRTERTVVPFQQERRGWMCAVVEGDASLTRFGQVLFVPDYEIDTAPERRLGPIPTA